MIWLWARYLTALSLTVLLYKKEVLISILQKHHGKRENPSMYLEQVLAQHCYGWYYYYSSFVKVGLDPAGYHCWWVPVSSRESQILCCSHKRKREKWAFLEETFSMKRNCWYFRFPFHHFQWGSWKPMCVGRQWWHLEEWAEQVKSMHGGSDTRSAQ